MTVEPKNEYYEKQEADANTGDPMSPIVIAGDIPCSGSHQLDRDLLPQSLPQPIPTSSDSDRHASMRITRKSQSTGHPPT